MEDHKGVGGGSRRRWCWDGGLDGRCRKWDFMPKAKGTTAGFEAGQSKTGAGEWNVMG